MKTVIAAVLAAVLAGAVGFYGGVTFQKGQATSGFSGMPGRAGFAGRGNGAARGAGGGFGGGGGAITTGTISASDANSITVKLASGGSKIIYADSNTRIARQDVLKLADLKAGDQVLATGSASNGVTTARQIQVIPPGGGFGYGGFGGAPNAAGTNGGANGSGATGIGN